MTRAESLPRVGAEEGSGGAEEGFDEGRGEPIDSKKANVGTRAKTGAGAKLLLESDEKVFKMRIHGLNIADGSNEEGRENIERTDYNGNIKRERQQRRRPTTATFSNWGVRSVVNFFYTNTNTRFEVRDGFSREEEDGSIWID